MAEADSVASEMALEGDNVLLVLAGVGECMAPVVAGVGLAHGFVCNCRPVAEYIDYT